MARTKSWASTAVGVLLLAALSACGSGSAAADKGAGATGPLAEDELLAEYVDLVAGMDVIEWQGEALPKAPSHGGKRAAVDVSGRWFRKTGDSELTMTARAGGQEETVDYLVLGDKVYFNSDDWGFVAKDCWADITGDAARSWGLPAQLDPTWAVTGSRPVRLEGEGLQAAAPNTDVIAGLPRGFYPQHPAVLGQAEGGVDITRHGDLIVVGVDVANMWSDVADADRAAYDRRGAWWSMTLEEASDTAALEVPEHVFDPAVTPPSSCTKA